MKSFEFSLLVFVYDLCNRAQRSFKKENFSN
jgi:hypothetical protein